MRLKRTRSESRILLPYCAMPCPCLFCMLFPIPLSLPIFRLENEILTLDEKQVAAEEIADRFERQRGQTGDVQSVRNWKRRIESAKGTSTDQRERIKWTNELDRNEMIDKGRKLACCWSLWFSSCTICTRLPAPLLVVRRKNATPRIVPNLFLRSH